MSDDGIAVLDEVDFTCTEGKTARDMANSVSSTEDLSASTPFDCI